MVKTEDTSLQNNGLFYSVLSRSIKIRPEDGLPASLYKQSTDDTT
jgi:hypothetical protein